MSFVTSFIDEDEWYTICPVCDEYIPIYKEDIKDYHEGRDTRLYCCECKTYFYLAKD